MLDGEGTWTGFGDTGDRVLPRNSEGSSGGLDVMYAKPGAKAPYDAAVSECRSGRNRGRDIYEGSVVIREEEIAWVNGMCAGEGAGQAQALQLRAWRWGEKVFAICSGDRGRPLSHRLSCVAEGEVRKSRGRSCRKDGHTNGRSWSWSWISACHVVAHARLTNHSLATSHVGRDYGRQACDSTLCKSCCMDAQSCIGAHLAKV